MTQHGHCAPILRQTLALAVMVLGCLVVTAPQAQTVPGAGDAVREVPPAPALPGGRRLEAPVTVPAAPQAAPTGEAADGTLFLLRELILPETRAVPRQELMALLQPFVGTQIGQRDLNAMAALVRDRYQQAGYTLVGVGFPSQDVSKGVVRIAIVEPTIGRIQVVAGSDPPVSETRARGLMHFFGVAEEELLSIHDIDRAMFTLNDLPGVAAKATLSPSGDEGIFDLSVELGPRKAHDLALSFDNHGSKVNGEYRLGALVRFNNPLRIGDNLDLRVMGSTSGDLVLGRIAYEMPLGHTPWRLALGHSKIDYELGDTFRDLDAKGTAEIYDLSVSYPLIRSRPRNLIARLGIEDKTLVDRIRAFGVRTDKHVASTSASLSYEGRDEWLGGGYVGAAAQAVFGQLRIKSPDARAADASLGERKTQGDFFKFNVQASRLQGITREASLFVGLTAQWATRNLDSSEKLTLGGPRGVRAYPSAEGASDEGVLVTSELRYWIDERWTVFGLVDWARGKSLRRPVPGEQNTRVLRGSGLGVYFTDKDLFTLKATLAWRGNEQPRSESGNDNPRLFVELQRSF